MWVLTDGAPDCTPELLQNLKIDIKLFLDTTSITTVLSTSTLNRVWRISSLNHCTASYWNTPSSGDYLGPEMCYEVGLWPELCIHHDQTLCHLLHICHGENWLGASNPGINKVDLSVILIDGFKLLFCGWLYIFWHCRHQSLVFS